MSRDKWSHALKIDKCSPESSFEWISCISVSQASSAGGHEGPRDHVHAFAPWFPHLCVIISSCVSGLPGKSLFSYGNYPREPVYPRNKGVDARDLGPVFSSVERDCCWYLPHRGGGRSKLTPDKGLKGAASCERSTAVTHLCSSKATSLQQAAGILLKISWRRRGCV